MVVWNLVDALSGGSARRFYLPLAAFPSDYPLADKSLYQITEQYTNDATATRDIALHIDITPPATGFISTNGNPHPAIRLYAMTDGVLKFVPADASNPLDRLVLSITGLYATSASGLNLPKWFERWLEAGTTPQTIVYENIRRAQLEQLLQAAPVNSTTFPNFPNTVTNETEKTNFINAFLQGKGVIPVAAGEIIGEAAPAVSSPDPIEQQPRLLTLHVHYNGHTQSSPQPMNPRELFHLLFGNDSIEAANHPLLLRLNEIGAAGTQIPATRRMLLRPPLRTSRRLKWEADLEIDVDSAQWAKSAGLQGLVNGYSQGNRSFSDVPYTGNWKCNLFVADLCLRSGFRVLVNQVNYNNGAQRFHYFSARQYFNRLKAGSRGTNASPGAVTRKIGNKAVIWARRWDSFILAKPEADRVAALNELIIDEGRCFILVIEDTRPNTAGHILLIDAFDQAPVWENNNPVPKSGAAFVYEARSYGATNDHDDLQRDANGELLTDANGDYIPNLTPARDAYPWTSDGTHNYLFAEITPGKDPDTLQGLADLNISG